MKRRPKIKHGILDSNGIKDAVWCLRTVEGAKKPFL